MAMINKKPTMHLKEIQISNVKFLNKTLSVLDLIRYKSLRTITYATSMVFFCITFVYYGISFTMDSVGLNIYVNTVIISSAETLAYIITNKFIPSTKRKKTSIIGYLIACVLSCAFIFLKTDESNCEGICTIMIIQIVFAAVNTKYSSSEKLGR